jgi:inositol-phosphate phosphatase/L-galactose 1-phosphate phosphatase/histidinol-phosphatase
VITCPPEFVALAHRLAEAAGERIRTYFRRSFDIEHKQDTSLVTIADRETEQAMRRILAVEAPEHGIEGEEFGTMNGDAEWVWRLDPIDGTNSFVSGSPLFVVLIALVHRGLPVLGIVDQPILGERWLAHGSEATTLNGSPAKARACPVLDQALLYTSGPKYFDGGAETILANLVAATKLTRYSADGYSFGLLASGHIDVVVEKDLQAHDYAAAFPVIENAGGVCTNWKGERPDMASDDHLVAAGDPAIHAEVLEILNGS